MHIFQAGCFLYGTLKGTGLEHILFSRFVRVIDVNFICTTCYRDIPCNPSIQTAQSQLYTGGRMGIAFIIFSDTVNIIWILESAKCVNEISRAAVGKRTSGSLLFLHSTLGAEAIYFWILKESYWRAEKRTIFETFTQSDNGFLDYIYSFKFHLFNLNCGRSFWYSRSLGLLAPFIHGMITYVQEPMEIGGRGSMGWRLNGNTLAAVNGHLRPLRESVTYGRDVGVGVPTAVIS
jgi:hypothetical protein